MEKLDNVESRIKLDKTLGYYYLVVKGHPLADKYGKFYYHRYVASLKYGRWLTTDDQVDHINCNKLDNSFDNLQVITRSAHAVKTLLDRGFVFKENKDVVCSYCKMVFSTKEDYKFCSRTCCELSSRLFEVSKEDLHDLVWSYPTTKVAEMFNVSDTAISKRCKILGVSKPPRGYWNKKKAGKI